MVEARDRDDELNRFWNGLAAGDPGEEPCALDPRDQALLRRLDAAGALPAGRSARQAWPTVLARISTAAEPRPASRPIRFGAEATASPNGHGQRTAPAALPRAGSVSRPALPALPLPAPRKKSVGGDGAPRDAKRFSALPLGQLATAALIVLTLTASLVLFGPLGRAPRAFLTHLPAIGGVLPAPDEITTEALLDEPVADLPVGHAAVGVGYYRLPPGVSAEWSARAGLSFFIVDQGTVDISSAGGTRVLTSGEQTTGPSSGALSIRNIGEEVARVIEVKLLAAGGADSASCAHTEYSDPLQGTADCPIVVSPTLPGGPGQVTLERMTLPAGSALPPFSAAEFDWIGIGAGRLGVTLHGDRLPFRWDSGEERTYGNFEPLPVIPAGAEVTLRNVGDDSLILYRLRIMPQVLDSADSAQASEFTTEMLLDTDVAALPAGHAAVGFGYHRLQPGVTGSWPGLTGTELLTVEQGTVEVAGAEGAHTLAAGDQIALPISGAYTIRNSGETEARVLETSLLDAAATFSGSTAIDRYSDPTGGSVVWPIKVATTLPAGPGHVALERLTLEAGSVVPAYTSSDFDWIGVDAGRVGIALSGERLPFRWDSGEERTYGLGQQLPIIVPGTEVTLRNVGDDLLVLYRLRITPQAAATPSPDPSQEITTETLLDESVAALPKSHAQLLVNLTHMEPEVSAGYSGQVGTFLYAVEQGTVELAVATGNQTLAAGDRIAVPIDGSISMRNIGADEAHFIEVQVLDAVATNSGPAVNSMLSDPLRITTNWPIEIATILPGGPGRVTLTRLSLPPGATLPTFTATGLDWTGAAAGRVGVTPRGERLPFRWDPGEERTFGIGGQIPTFVAGTEVTLRNVGDDPLILYRLIITPEE